MKLVIFDMDGLIFDSERLFKDKLSEAMAERGYMLELEVYLSSLGANSDSSRRIMLDRYGEDYPYEEISAEARRAFNEYVMKNGIPVKRGIPELLNYLNSCGIRCAVASSTRSELVKMYLEMSRLDGYFDIVIGGEAVKPSKPAPDIFLKACGEAGVKPSEALVLEDSENGILAAVNGGIPVICIPDMKQHDSGLLGKCAACVKDAYGVMDYIEQHKNSRTGE